VRSGAPRRPAAFKRGARRNETSIPPHRRAGLDLRSLAQRGDPRSPAGLAREEPEAKPHQRAVVAIERGHVGHGAQGHKIQEGPHIQLAPEARPHGGDQREHQTHARQALVREAALGSMGVQKGQRGQRRLGHEVVVDDDHVEARVLGPLNALVIRRAHVARDEQRRPGGERAIEAGVREAVAAHESIREERTRHRAKALEGIGQEGRGGGAIDVVVTEDRHGLTDPAGPCQAIGGHLSVRHLLGRREVRELGIEPGASGHGLRQAALKEQARERARHGELARQRSDVRRIHDARVVVGSLRSVRRPAKSRVSRHIGKRRAREGVEVVHGARLTFRSIEGKGNHRGRGRAKQGGEVQLPAMRTSRRSERPPIGGPECTRMPLEFAGTRGLCGMRAGAEICGPSLKTV
jgi:hypothetical protein